MRISDWSSDVCSSDLDWNVNASDAAYQATIHATPARRAEFAILIEDVVSGQNADIRFDPESGCPIWRLFLCKRSRRQGQNNRRSEQELLHQIGRAHV